MSAPSVHPRPGPRLTRRELLIGMAALGLSACMPRGTGEGGGYVFGVPDPAAVPGLPGGLFALGVASGDPSPDGFVLWTRLAPQPTADAGGMPDITVPLRWQVATDPGFANLVADGEVSTTASVAHSAHITLRRLTPDTTYWYRFSTGGQTSPVGRTRTTPALGASVDQLKMVFAAHQDYQARYFQPWSHVAAEQPDVVVFLGDYIFEDGAAVSGGRSHNSPEATSLEDYRKRYGLYKSDARLQAAHAAAPWIVTWNDREVSALYAGLVPRAAVDLATFSARRAAAYQAFWEHQPLRTDPLDGALTMHRSIAWGSLVDFIVLDGRQHRSDQPCGDGGAMYPDCADRDNPSNTVLGASQKSWLQAQLEAERGHWSVLANPVTMTPVPLYPNSHNMDWWDGYPAERREVLASLSGVRNPVVLSGARALGVASVHDDPPGSPTVATEFLTQGIAHTTAYGEDRISILINFLPGWQTYDLLEVGYARATVTLDAFVVDFMSVRGYGSDVLEPATRHSTWRVADGIPGAIRVA